MIVTTMRWNKMLRIISALLCCLLNTLHIILVLKQWNILARQLLPKGVARPDSQRCEVVCVTGLTRAGRACRPSPPAQRSCGLPQSSGRHRCGVYTCQWVCGRSCHGRSCGRVPWSISMRRNNLPMSIRDLTLGWDWWPLLEETS